MASTSGHDRSAFNSSAEVALQEKLSNIASTNNLDVEFGEFKIDAPQSTIDEYHGDANLYAESIAKAYEEDTASNTRETKTQAHAVRQHIPQASFLESQQEELVG